MSGLLYDWARAWGVTSNALADLRTRIVAPRALDAGEPPDASETAVLSEVRLEASRAGMRLWRNNVGAGYSEDGSFMRWGLANDSAAVNKILKSADLIGVRPLTITQTQVGTVVGQFVSRECKRRDWHYTGTPREIAQVNWAAVVNSLGGDARFATGPGSL